MPAIISFLLFKYERLNDVVLVKLYIEPAKVSKRCEIRNSCHDGIFRWKFYTTPAEFFWWIQLLSNPFFSFANIADSKFLNFLIGKMASAFTRLRKILYRMTRRTISDSIQSCTSRTLQNEFTASNQFFIHISKLQFFLPPIFCKKKKPWNSNFI